MSIPVLLALPLFSMFPSAGGRYLPFSHPRRDVARSLALAIATLACSALLGLLGIWMMGSNLWWVFLSGEVALLTLVQRAWGRWLERQRIPYLNAG